MLFKSVDELPIPRYDVDDSTTLIPNATISCSTNFESQNDDLLAKVESLVVLSPRFVNPCRSVYGRKAATISIKRTCSIHPSEYGLDSMADGDFDEDEEHVMTQSFEASLHQIESCKHSNMLLLSIPVLEDDASVALASTVISNLTQLKSVYVFSPGTIFDQAVAVLRGSKSPNDFANFPDAMPPTYLTGTAASFLTICAEKSLSCLALIVRSDGSYGHEGVNSADLELILRSLRCFLGDYTPGGENVDVSRLYI